MTEKRQIGHDKVFEIKKIILTIIVFINYSIAFSQTQVCGNRLDTAQVITVAKRHNAYWNVNWYAPPSLQLDTQSCRWTVISYKSRHTDRGDCKHTNGCTLTKTVTLVIDAKTRKVLSRKKKKTLHPNYE